MLETRATRENAFVQDKLYVVGSEPNNERMSRMLPSRFNRIVPQLKASDFDYIIFDMPAVNQISVTPRLAAYMDMVLLVVESRGHRSGHCSGRRPTCSPPRARRLASS